MTSTHRICYIAAAAAELLANAGKKAYPIIIRAEHKKMQPEIQGAEERRQRPRVSEGLGPVDAAPELEAERLLSAVLADIALLSTQSHVFCRRVRSCNVPLLSRLQQSPGCSCGSMHLPQRGLFNAQRALEKLDRPVILPLVKYEASSHVLRYEKSCPAVPSFSCIRR